MTPEDKQERKLELTLDQAVKNSQAAWARFRDAQLYAFHASVPVLEFARTNEDDFRVYCQDRSVKGDLPETQVAELMIQEDPDADAISRERRAEYGAAIGWFADRNLCPETDAEKAVQLAKQKGRIKGVAQLYRTHKDADNPEVAATKERARATKAAKAMQANLSAAVHSGDPKSQHTGIPRDSNVSQDSEPLFYCRDAADTHAKASEESTDPERYVRHRTDLIQELSRKLDEAGVVPCSRDAQPDSGVGLYLVIRDQLSTQPRMFEIVDTDANYRLLVDAIINRHAEKQTRSNPRAA